MAFGREPVLYLAALNAVIQVFIAFGLDISAEQLSLINAAFAAIFGLIARQQVTPVKASGSGL